MRDGETARRAISPSLATPEQADLARHLGGDVTASIRVGQWAGHRPVRRVCCVSMQVIHGVHQGSLNDWGSASVTRGCHEYKQQLCVGGMVGGSFRDP